jgi:hypothetical protein
VDWIVVFAELNLPFPKKADRMALRFSEIPFTTEVKSISLGLVFILDFSKGRLGNDTDIKIIGHTPGEGWKEDQGFIVRGVDHGQVNRCNR